LSQDRGGFIESNGAFSPNALSVAVTVSQPWPFERMVDAVVVRARQVFASARAGYVRHPRQCPVCHLNSHPARSTPGLSCKPSIRMGQDPKTMKVRLALVQLQDDTVARPMGSLTTGAGMTGHEPVNTPLISGAKMAPAFALWARCWLVLWPWAWLPVMQDHWPGPRPGPSRSR
jgi:hypothetical protein